MLNWFSHAFGSSGYFIYIHHFKSCALLHCSAVSDCLQPHGLLSARLLCPWRFSKREYWSGLPCPPPGDLPNPGTEPRSSALQADSLPSEPPGKPNYSVYFQLNALPIKIPAETYSFLGLPFALMLSRGIPATSLLCLLSNTNNKVLLLLWQPQLLSQCLVCSCGNIRHSV